MTRGVPKHSFRGSGGILFEEEGEKKNRTTGKG